MPTFNEIIQDLKNMQLESNKALASFIVVVPFLNECLVQVNIGGTITDDVRARLMDIMGVAEPKEIEDAKKLIAAAGITAAGTMVLIEKATKHAEECAQHIAESNKLISDYIRKIQ